MIMEKKLDLQYKSTLMNRGYIHLELMGSFSYPNVLRIKDDLHELIDEETKNLLVDLNNLDYVDSVGIGIIVGLQVRIKELKGNIYLICEKVEILKIIQLVGLDKAFELFPSLRAARAKLFPDQEG
jgi:anti-sigma B factor antagonist